MQLVGYGVAVGAQTEIDRLSDIHQRDTTNDNVNIEH